MRPIRYTGTEHQMREMRAVDESHGDNFHTYGDGRTVLLVVPRFGPRKQPHCVVIGEDGADSKTPMGTPFVYADFFFAPLPAKLCRSCGQEWTESACGPTHARVQARAVADAGKAIVKARKRAERIRNV